MVPQYYVANRAGHFFRSSFPFCQTGPGIRWILEKFPRSASAQPYYGLVPCGLGRCLLEKHKNRPAPADMAVCGKPYLQFSQ